MKDVLDLILKNITTHPDSVDIEESTQDNLTVYTIKVDPEDMGRVIGKDGKVIRALRSLAHVIAIRQNKRFRIKLYDENGPDTDSSSETLASETAPQETPKEETADLIEGAIDVPESGDAEAAEE